MLILVSGIFFSLSTDTNKIPTGKLIADLAPAEKSIARDDVLLLKFKPGVSQTKKYEVSKRFAMVEIDEIKEIVHVMRVNPNSLDKVKTALSKNPMIEFVERDYLSNPSILSDDPRITSQYYISLMNYYSAWDISIGNSEVIIANPDTGINMAHEDLRDVLLTELSFNTVDNSNDVNDIYGHGTKTAGCIGADTNNKLGIASASWNKKIIPIKISNREDGAAYTSDMAEAIRYAADHGAKVVSLSYTGACSATIDSAGDYLRSKGGLLFMSAGNDATNPGCINYDGIITVTATTNTDTNADFSNFGNYIDLSAPGEGIYTTSMIGGYIYTSGTSFSSPIAASVATLLFSAYPEATNLQVEQALIDSAIDLGENGYDIYYGHGRVDAYGSIVSLQNEINTNIPPDTQPPYVEINQPVTNSILIENTIVEISAEDLSGIKNVDLYINDELYGSDSSVDNGFLFYLDIADYNAGDYRLTAIVYDVYDNMNSAEITVSIEKSVIPATLIITAPQDNSATLDKKLLIITNTTKINSVDFYVNDIYKFTDNSIPFSYSITNTRPYNRQTIQIKALGFDSNSNSIMDSVSITIGTQIEEEPVISECNDNIDNDGDGSCDYLGCSKNKNFIYPPDPDCTDADDKSESN